MAGLPGPKKRGTLSLEETLARRRSVRSFARRALDREQIAQLLWAAQGVTEGRLRTAPSAGALYPLEVYLVTSDGIYHYRPLSHELERLAEGDFLPQLSRAALGQECVREAPVSVVIAAVHQRVERRYGERAALYIWIEAGHVAQNIHLQAVAMGLGSVPVGAFDDRQVHRVLSLPEDQMPLYVIPVGYTAE
ncbi:MAG: SagB/ThcOx family dehydrogenase [Chloroflexi bacterium]|nr:SagB/ThcOx family dehydrogenase [Chloroflexota bacterium]